MNCLKSFIAHSPDTRKRFTADFKARVINDYITNKNSLSELGKRYAVHPSSINRWIMEYVKNPVSQGIAAVTDFSGFICIDGKVLKVSGEKRVLLWACDAKTKRLLCYVYADKENIESSKLLLSLLKNMFPEQVHGITSDLGRGRCFISPIKEYFPQAVHQICLVHFQRYLNLRMPRSCRSKYFWRNMIFRKVVKAIIKATTKNDARVLLTRLLSLRNCFPATYHKRFIGSIERNFDLLTAYMENPELPSTSNIIEAWNRKLNRKLKNMDGFKSELSCKSFLKLWFDVNTMI
jgi:transposase-like protein